MIIYMDDMLIMGNTLSEIHTARDTTIYLLQSLEFVINFKKSILTPSQSLEFLGVIVDSLSMTLRIPQEKTMELRKICTETLTSKNISLRKLAKIIGKLQATAPAFTWAPLQIRHLQQVLITGTRKGNSYETKTVITREAKIELEWWIKNINLQNGNPILVNPPEMYMSTDAAKGTSGGWGAECQGQSTGGPWTMEEKKLHINVLELLAAELGLKTFTKLKEVSSIHLRMDNTTALSYLAKMGGTKNIEMINISKRIWSYLISKKITLTLEYIPSELNIIADWESRNWVDSSEWKLNHKIFLSICSILGTPEVDLFASRTSHQLQNYMSWKPDPQSSGTNALLQNWNFRFPYAFPPFCLIGQSLQKVNKHKNRMIIITPVWVSQPWYPLLLSMSIQNPILLPPNQNLLMNPMGEFHPLLLNSTLRLAAWLVSGRLKPRRDFQAQLPRLYPEQDPRVLESVTNRPGESLLAGVLQDKLVHFVVI